MLFGILINEGIICRETIIINIFFALGEILESNRPNALALDRDCLGIYCVQNKSLSNFLTNHAFWAEGN